MEATRGTLPSYTIKVAGTALNSAWHVLSVRVQKEVGRIPSAHLVLRDGDPASSSFEIGNSDTFKPGNDIEIWGGYQGQESLIFKGLVVRHGIELRSSGTSRLNVVCRDAFVKMTMATHRKYFTGEGRSQPPATLSEGKGISTLRPARDDRGRDFSRSFFRYLDCQRLFCISADTYPAGDRIFSRHPCAGWHSGYGLR